MALKWTQSKLTKAIGLASVVGAASALSPAAQALKTDFGVEYRATGFYAQSGAFDVAGDPRNDNDNGFAHLIRVKSDFLDEDTGISLHTSVELAGDRWVGDQRGYTGAGANAFNANNKGDNVRLDLGYVQIPFGHTVVRVGRQATSYNNCFLVCDDRRDRVLLIQPFSKTFQVLAIYDRRRDLDTFENTDNGDQFVFGFVSKPMGLDISALYIKYLKNYEGDITQATNTSGPYAVSGADLFSGYISGNIGEVAKATVGANYFTNGKVTTPANNGQFVTEDALSQYIRLEGSVGVMDWGVQYVGAQDGGYISPGFDTYSSLIQNNPESTANPTSLYTMAQSYGVEGYDESVLAGKLTWNVTPKLAITGAVGQLDIDNPAPPGGNNSVSDESTFYDLQLSYQVNKTLRTWVTYGILEENEAGALSGNTLLGALPSADFSQDDVQAASVNLAVSF
ncbi:MAG: hypothetical protein VX935_16180 [Pseudomonadota bacterium]|jgi:hypothetical protein|uniref:hypothetical protein n=1 Tax=Alloalcanivorax venustensis TaxID=172371 RepID=UPI000E9D338D|nr:hypothetical protein [Pseudomonadota bacterium]HBM25092.1 hypothetical protein [Alcanivorax sp.]|tara:strand:- start:1259 stop:2614 length:1356 start_codon:yes stop_codon:yes gene_type:complete